MTIQLVVYGSPKPQGSKTAFVRGNRAVVVDAGTSKSRASHAAWRQAVATAARDYQEANQAPLITGPVGVTISFFLEKPKSKPKWKIWPDVKPDIDKLTRSTFDAITKVLWTDDAEVCALNATKYYGDPPRAEITIWTLDEPH